MKCLVIGGAGYVGYELAKQCISKGDDVVVFDNFRSGGDSARKRIEALKIEYIDASIENKRDVYAAIHKYNFDIVYHLAALHYIPYCIEHADEVFDINYLGVQNIVASVKDLPNTKLIFASSASVYGSPREVCTLTTATIPNDIYGASKLAAENLIEHQLNNYVILRLFNVYGELDPHPHLIPKAVNAAVKNENLNLGTATAERDFVYVKDVASAFYIARNAPAAEKYIVASGETHSVNDTVDKIYEITQSTGAVQYDTSANMRANDASRLCGDSSKIRTLGWSPTISFNEGLYTAVAAAKEATVNRTL